MELCASVKYKRYVVLAAWGGIVTILAVIYAYYWGIKPYSSCYQADYGAIPASGNQLTGLTYCRYDPNTNKLRFAVSVGTLLTQNAPLGIFKTAAARTIKVKDLQLRFCESSGSPAVTALQGDTPPEKIIPSDNGFKEIISRVVDARKRWGVDIDLSNPIEFAIDNLDCRMFDDDNLRLAVQCRRAVVNSGWPLVNLRGHVIVTGANGVTLESNHVIWDTRRQTFTADGIYFMRRGESTIAGKGIHVDSHLNIADAKNVKL